jgi:hypothetical protein
LPTFYLCGGRSCPMVKRKGDDEEVTHGGDMGVGA